MDSTARISTRIAERKGRVQSALAKHQDVKWVAESLRERFNAKLIYLETEDVLEGKLELGVNVGFGESPKRRGKWK